MVDLASGFGVRRLLVSLLVLGAGLCSAACGGDDEDPNAPSLSNLTPGQLCGVIANNQCERAYTCSQDPGQGYGNSKGDCSGLLIDKYGCTSAAASKEKVCQGSGTSDFASASKCNEQILAATCEQILSGRNISGFAPACGACSP